MKRKILTLLLVGLSVSATMAQGDGKGYLVGSFESNSILYSEDKVTNAQMAEGGFGTNNYLKTDYYAGNFSAGLQLEAYQPALVGYPGNLEGAHLTNYYIAWSDGDFAVTAGTYYDQFGSGLLFRTYEDRTLGMNTAMMGARISYHYKDIASVKAIWGAPRLGMEAAPETQVRGLDGSLSISSLLKMENTNLSVEGSLLNRYEPISPSVESEGGKASTLGYSARLNFERSGFLVRAEYIDAGEKIYSNPNILIDGKSNLIKNGNAQLLEMSYSYCS